MKIKVLLVENYELVLEGIAALLEKEKDIFVIAKASNGRQAVAFAEKHRPDIVLMDVSLPGLNGIEATRRIIENNPAQKVIALSMYADKRFVKGMLSAGAAGYLLKEGSYQTLVYAIRDVLKGNVYLSPEITGIVVKDYRNRLIHETYLPVQNLTRREMEVLQLLVEGSSAKQIASRLNLSIKTIESHRRQMMEKLNIHSIAELTKYAIREGITVL